MSTPTTSAATDWERIADHRGRRLARLERELRHVHAERRRLERLLATALRIAAGPDCQPLAMLDVVAAITGDRLERAAWVDEERAEQLDRPLRETDPDRLSGSVRRAV